MMKRELTAVSELSSAGHFFNHDMRDQRVYAEMRRPEYSDGYDFCMVMPIDEKTKYFTDKGAKSFELCWY